MTDQTKQQMPLAGEAAVARKLANGVTITMERLSYLRSAAAGIWIKTGSANESEAHSGVSHFLEHLFFKGTAKRSARELVDAIESKGGQLNAFTSRDYTCIYVKTLDTHIDTGIEILADIVKNSQFCDLEKERNVVLEEIAAIEDVPEDFVHENLAKKFWPGHPLGRPVSGLAESVRRLSIDDIRAYYTAWYRPQNMYFSIAGNFDETTVLEQVRTEWGDLAPGVTAERCGPPSFGAGTENMKRDIGQSHVCLGFPGPVANDPRRYVYDFLSNTLGGGATSRLFEKIREDEGLAYSIYSFHAAHLSSGILGVYAAVAPQNLDKTLELIAHELRDLRENPLEATEFDANREQLKGGMLMALESTFVRMSRMAKSMMYFGRVIPVEEVIKSVDAVTPSDVQHLAQEILAAEKCALVTLGPANGKRGGRLPL